MTDALDDYQKKRNFAATPEPSGAVKKKSSGQALQFCIQKHDASHLHYDFRLELQGTLKSWAVPKGPSLDPHVKRLAVEVEDHPLDYATFEGNIPEGHYGAGDVIVWDRGVWKPIGDPVELLKKGRLKFELEGEKLQGIWNLVRSNQEGKKQLWFLIKHQDEAARPESEFDVTKAMPDSVLSDRTLGEKKPKAAATQSKKKASPSAPKPSKPRTTGQLTGAKAGPQPASLKPQLATLVEHPPTGDWHYEIKFDGYRMLARVEKGEVKLFTRNGHDWTAKLPELAKAIATLKLESAWLDGEVVVLDSEGVPSFQQLQQAFDADKSGDIVFYLFDMPYLNGADLRNVPLQARRSALKKVLNSTKNTVLRYSDDFAEDAASLLRSACQMNMEGLIGKRAGSLYVSRRSDDWIKLKCKQGQEFVVVGFTEPKGSRHYFGALLLGLHDKDSGELRYAGKVGTGFDGETLLTVHKQLKPLEVKTPPVVNPPTGFEAKGVHWLKPQQLAQVSYAQLTEDGAVRHAVFQGLRHDKPVKNITRDVAQPTPSDSHPKLTHAERVIDGKSGATKGQLADYYVSVADWLLPTLKDRPLALVRAPEGIAGELFFQKNAHGLALASVDSQKGESLIVINSVKALLEAVQMNTVEFHSGNAKVPELERPDRFVLDLDPDPALPWKSMVEATQLILTLLDELGLTSFIKTSGGKGVHIVVPLTRRDSWDTVKTFTHALVKYMAHLMPGRFSAVAGPKNRVGKIFIDYLRNGKGATTINAYAARAREGLPVSVPIAKDELSEIKGADAWTIFTLPKRLAALAQDPWAEYGKTRQMITKSMRKTIGLDE
ncbi:DNA ligase D [Pseudomonas helleri]|uniref:DNA ligase D n=1 Tax=Pseudomonas helleri TaxID=1608996 RepID=UPI0030DC367E